jgi:hypothetical protein
MSIQEESDSEAIAHAPKVAEVVQIGRRRRLHGCFTLQPILKFYFANRLHIHHGEVPRQFYIHCWEVRYAISVTYAKQLLKSMPIRCRNGCKIHSVRISDFD